jgi:L-iditol 2-dehydrogenase
MASTSDFMRAAVLHRPLDLRMETRPIPHPGRDEVLVRVGAVGICGSDLHFYENGRAGSSIVTGPFVMGHEFGGSIAEIGDGVMRELGERVAIEPGIQCGRCGQCKAGRYNHCENMRFLGAAPYDGAFQEYVVVPEDRAFAIPDSVSDEAAALLEPLSVALWANSRAETGEGETVVIVGAGPVGVLCAMVAKERGVASVTMVDRAKERRDRARAIIGATVLAPSQFVDAGASFDIVVECSGSAAGSASAAAAVRTEGRLVIVGVGAERLDLPMNLVQEGEVRITGSHRYRGTWPTAVAMAAEGRVDLDALVSARFPLEEAAAALRATTRRRSK